jgi:hypothetical protein
LISTSIVERWPLRKRVSASAGAMTTTSTSRSRSRASAVSLSGTTATISIPSATSWYDATSFGISACAGTTTIVRSGSTAPW